MKAREAEQTRHCRTCGIDITVHGRYTRWTQCSLCYWTACLERCEPLQTMLRRKAEIRSRLDSLPNAIRDAQALVDRHRAKLKAETPWWRALLGDPADQQLEDYRNALWSLQDELRKFESEHARLEGSIKYAKKVKKQVLDLQIARNAAEHRQRITAQEYEAFCSTSAGNLAKEFDRSNFHIQRNDYRRGNPIDNYFRNSIEGVVLDAFGNTCSFCGATADLTFDHYAIPKNEGGNFTLVLSDKKSIRLNIVVLCRGCNAAKGQTSYLSFFSFPQREAIRVALERLLASLIKDMTFHKIIKEWSSKK